MPSVLLAFSPCRLGVIPREHTQYYDQGDAIRQWQHATEAIERGGRRRDHRPWREGV